MKAELECCLEDINAHYNQEELVPRSFDHDGWHFEFDEVFGLAYSKTHQMLMIIMEDDEFWFIPDRVWHYCVSPLWIKSLTSVSNRMNKYLNHEK